MLVQTNAIVLHTLKYSESSLIAHCYTKDYGIQSFILKGILSAKKGGLRKAQFLPLSQLEIVYQHKSNGGLQYIKEAKISFSYTSIHTDIKKNSIALFLSEIVHKSVYEEEPNPTLFSFLESAFHWLDTQEEVTNFHLLFLVKLSKFLGFYPNIESEDALHFDLENGNFTSTPRGKNHLSGPVAQTIKTLLGINFANEIMPKINQKLRRDVLDTLVHYYELHLQGFVKPKSLPILLEIFD